MPTVRLFPPLAGVSEDQSFSDQEPITARDAENVVSLDPSNGRTRLTKRAGTSLYCPDRLATSSTKVREIAQVITNNVTLDYTALGAGNETQEWTVAKKNKGARRCVVSSRGDLYVLENASNTIYRFNSDGGLISTTQLLVPDIQSDGPFVYAMDVDEFDSIFVGVSQSVTDQTSDYRRLMRYQLEADNEHRLAWELKQGGDDPNNVRLVRDLRVKGGKLYTIQWDDGTGAIWMRAYEDIDGTVPPRAISLEIALTTTGTGSTNFVGGVDVDDAGTIYVAFYENNIQYLKAFSAGSGSTPIWSISSTTRGGIGLGVYTRDGLLATTGETGGTQAWVNLFRLNADSSPTHLWGYITGGSSAAKVGYRRPIIDAFGNVHVCFPNNAVVPTVAPYQAFNDSGTRIAAITPAAAPLGGVALPPTNPDYAASTTPPDRPEFVYLAMLGAGYYKYRLVSVAATTGSPRTFFNLAACSRNLLRFDDTGTTTVGSLALNGTSRYVQMTTAYQKVYVTDGVNYNVYDPEDDSVTAWVSETSGTIPKRCSLLETWRGRMVLAGDPDNPHMVHMSALGDPNDWDLYPPTTSSTQAVSLATAPQTGDLTDIVTSIVSYSDDVLVIGGDSSIWVLRGDPAADGSLDLVTKATGMAYGRSSCVGPQGELYFYGSRGGVYVMAGQGEVQRISVNRIERQLQNVDLGTYYARLLWDYKNEGLWVLFFPYGSGGTSIRHFFWSAKHDAWWPIRFGNTVLTDVQPTAAWVSDADDPDDRTVLFGCEDGYVRKLDPAAGYDETGAGVQTPIGAYAIIGPMLSDDRQRLVKAHSLWATMGRDGECWWELYTDRSPDVELTAPVAQGRLSAGQNGKIPLRRKGAAAWLKLVDNGSGAAWAVESLSMDVFPGDRIRG